MPATTGAPVAAPAGARRPLLFGAAPRPQAPSPPLTTTRCRRAAHGTPPPPSSSSGAAARRRGVKEYVEAAREMARHKDGGPPRWFSPLECGGGRVPGAPTLLYLPGTVSVSSDRMFDLWCLHIPVEDRTPFAGLVEYVERAVKSESSRAPDRPIYLVGESVGACVALAVAARNPGIDLVLILVNPGNLMKMPEAFVGRGLSLQEAGPRLSETTSSMLDSLTILVDVLTKESIVCKLEMLKASSSFVNSRLHAVKAQTLVLASGNDELLPSTQEAERLRGALEKCRTRVFRDNGHKILLEAGFDLATTIKGAGYYRRTRRTDFVADYIPPTPDELQQAIDHDRYAYAHAPWQAKLEAGPKACHRPVMLSTLGDGRVVRGLAGLPREGPAVLVGYHMLLGLELGPMVTGILSGTGVHVRGLAHPFMFDGGTERLMPDSAHFDLHRVMGAVPVTGANFYRLLADKEFVLLYPGGAREALHRKGEEYKLFWPEQPEFVRMASRFGATIVPFGVVGEDDICHLLLDYNDLQKVPFYGMLDEALNRDGLRLRTDSMGEVKDQRMHPLLLAPKVPGRFYFVFGKPIETRGREKELRDKEAAQRLYLQVKSEVEGCINYLKEKREEDPYRSILPRLLYQALHGPNAEIPTFEP
ncbi:transferase transferring acyl groups other than amino-acyl groups [Zea mays]|uniref:Transferase transferring acyl groups other than amino-acyl groups n=1 Tax=Zea mays TaxID=4577 RepID=A0A1D6I889_MAIZE|nr:transferase transferring acyl groups other than amino-acyl groups [Zea mays]